MRGTLPERNDAPQSSEAARAARSRARKRRLQRRRRRVRQLGLAAVIAVAALTFCAYGFLNKNTPDPKPEDSSDVSEPNASGGETLGTSPEGTDPAGSGDNAVPAINPDPAPDPEPDPEPVPEPDPEPLTPLEEEVQEILASIITEDMTKLEQLRAVFDFTRTSIAYTGDSDKSDWKDGAYSGLMRRRGDCFTYYAVSRAMLDALGFENLEVTRVGGPTSHYWNLVNYNGGWYHFDATPRSSKMPSFVSFMFTDKEAADYTEQAGRNYYTFDGSLYPERAVDPPEEETAE